MAELAVAANVPGAQSLHARLIVAVPGVLTYMPVPQAVQSMHGLAGFASWSHVPVSQATAGAAMPAQYSPTLHAVQGAFSFGFVRRVPAAHSPIGTHCPELGASE
jgi:hypothetical protein